MSQELTPEEIAGLKECVQCGAKPADLLDEAAPELEVLAFNFGDPYLFGVVCRVCGRVAQGKSKELAVARWQDDGHDGDIDLMTGELEEPDNDDIPPESHGGGTEQ